MKHFPWHLSRGPGVEKKDCSNRAKSHLRTGGDTSLPGKEDALHRKSHRLRNRNHGMQEELLGGGAEDHDQGCKEVGVGCADQGRNHELKCRH